MHKRYLHVDRQKAARDFRLRGIKETLDAQLGKETDTNLATKYDVPVSDIAGRRKELGIPAARSVNWIDWTPKMDALLGTKSDTALAKEFGVSQSSVSKRRNKLGVTVWEP